MIYTRVICVMLMNSLSLPRVFCVLCVCVRSRARAPPSPKCQERHTSLFRVFTVSHTTRTCWLLLNGIGRERARATPGRPAARGYKGVLVGARAAHLESKCCRTFIYSRE